MLSIKTTYAIQILDALRQSREGLSVQQLRERFLLLPVGTLISDTVRQLEAGRLICNVSPSPRGRRFRVMAALDRLTLYDLARVVDSRLVLGTPVGFSYWAPGYTEHHPQITALDQQIEQSVMQILQSTSVEALLGAESKPEPANKSKEQKPHYKVNTQQKQTKQKQTNKQPTQLIN